MTEFSMLVQAFAFGFLAAALVFHGIVMLRLAKVLRSFWPAAQPIDTRPGWMPTRTTERPMVPPVAQGAAAKFAVNRQPARRWP